MSPTDLRSIRTFPSLVKYLRDELDWPIETDDFDDLTFDYRPEELGIDPKTAAKVEEIKQLRPLVTNQPWGIFFIKFEPKRLPVVVLRRILRTLVIKKRASASKSHQATWNLHDLLFISSYGESDHRDITFAHFTEDDEAGDLPALRVLGWDDEDTVLHLEHAHKVLREKLRWPSDPHQVDEWGEQWSSAFTLRHMEVITTSKDLAIQLAHLATAIRKRVSKVLSIETESGPLHRLMKSFKKALIHDLYEEAFADMYAQTITYGLLSARVSRPAALVAENITDMVPTTNPFLKDLLSTFLTVGGRKGNIDFDELGINEVVHALRDANMEAILRDFGDRNPQEDPVIHFYELFLKEYNPKLRMQRGVFYTPRPVVSFIVRSVDEILRTEFGLEDGLADTTTWGEMLKRFPEINLPKDTDPEEPFVQILDPALGTGTFLVEVINIIHKTMITKWQKAGYSISKQQQLWNEYVPKHPRLYGFELLMAPYTIAHMKIGLKLWETGYRFGSYERAHIYLTNSLEPPSDIQMRLPDLLPTLAREAEAVNELKRKKQFTIIIGNPPYSNFGRLNKISFILNKLEDYKRNLKEKKINIDDDFIKFIRYGQHLIDTSGVGVFGMITNNSYLDGLTHRQMRFSLLSSFSILQIVNLHGSTLRQEVNPRGGVDENVFDIKQGVAISILCRKPRNKVMVKYRDIWGSRIRKYEELLKSAVLENENAIDPIPEYFFFVPSRFPQEGEYHRWVGFGSIFIEFQNGIKTDRDDLFFGFSKAEVETRLNIFFSSEGLRSPFKEKYRVEDSSSYRLLDRRHRNSFDPKCVLRCLYRPFDTRWLYYQIGLTSRPAFDVMKHLLGAENRAILACRQQAELGFQHVFCSNKIVECCGVSLKTREITSVFPLWLNLDANSNGLDRSPRPNFSEPFIEILCKSLGQPQDTFGLPKGFSSEDIFNYIYAVLYSPTYRSRYAEYLKIDFPRLPLTTSLELFRALAKLGGELVSQHLMESHKLGRHITKFIGEENPEMEKVSFSDTTVWVDKAQTTGFKGVPENVWEFHIGGYQVCEKWLKYRKGRRLTNDDIEHYQKIVVALNETIRLMAEIDKVVEKNGGWPAAFTTSMT